jgi:hypothetical protein
MSFICEKYQYLLADNYRNRNINIRKELVSHLIKELQVIGRYLVLETGMESA